MSSSGPTTRRRYEERCGSFAKSGGHRFSHEAILDAYLNSVYLGEGQYGIEDASRHYFGLGARQLNLSEASLLAGLIQARSLYDPAVNPARGRKRQVDVLRGMVRNGYITQAEASAAIRRPLQLTTGASLPGLAGVSFLRGAPFDWPELFSAVALLVIALTVSPPEFRGDGFDWFPLFNERALLRIYRLACCSSNSAAGRLRVRCGGARC